MSWTFDETGDYATVADDAALTLPDGDWTIAGWVKLDDNAGLAFQYFLSWNNASAAPSLNWYFQEAMNGADANELRLIAEDSGADEINLLSTGNPGTSTAWMHLALVRSGSTVTQYVDGSADGSDSNASFNAIDHTGSLYIGGRSDLNADRFFGGDMAEWAKWDRALSTDEIASLVAGFSPLFFPSSVKWYLPMHKSAGAVERVSNLTVAFAGDTTGADHPTGIIYPTAPMFQVHTAAAPPGGGSSVPVFMHHYKQMGAA